MSFSDYVLRTLAAVPLPERALVLGTAATRLAGQVAALGFATDSYSWSELADSALTLPSERYGWIITIFTGRDLEDVLAALENVRRLVRSGGWVMISVTESPELALQPDLEAGVQTGLERRGYALSEAPRQVGEKCQLIVRRVDSGTPG